LFGGGRSLTIRSSDWKSGGLVARSDTEAAARATTPPHPGVSVLASTDRSNRRPRVVDSSDSSKKLDASERGDRIHDRIKKERAVDRDDSFGIVGILKYGKRDDDHLGMTF
jgi:hypothetical protein